MLLDTPICDFDWPAPEFELKDPDGRVVNFGADFAGQATLVMFICNHCPYVQRIAGALAEITDRLMAKGIGVIAVMSNDYQEYPADSPENMRSYAQASGWNFPYLVDGTQEVGKAFGAVCTPDFFGFNAAGGLQYRGNLEGLEAAMLEIAISGQGPQDQRPSMGCSIKWT